MAGYCIYDFSNHRRYLQCNNHRAKSPEPWEAYRVDEPYISNVTMDHGLYLHGGFRSDTEQIGYAYAKDITGLTPNSQAIHASLLALREHMMPEQLLIPGYTNMTGHTTLVMLLALQKTHHGKRHLPQQLIG